MPQVFAICVSPSLRAPLKSTKTHGFMICSTFKRHLWHKSSRCVIWDPCPTSATNCHPQTWFFRIASSVVFNVFGQKLVACWRWEATAAARFVGICSCRIHDWGQCAAQERADVSIWIAQKATPIEKTMQDWWLMMTACLHLAFQIYIYSIPQQSPASICFLMFLAFVLKRTPWGFSALVHNLSLNVLIDVPMFADYPPSANGQSEMFLKKKGKQHQIARLKLHKLPTNKSRFIHWSVATGFLSRCWPAPLRGRVRRELPGGLPSRWRWGTTSKTEMRWDTNI